MYSFTGTADGNYPNGGLVLDAKGNLYGTTATGTTNSFYGTVYKLNKSGELTVLHQLNGYSDGADPTVILQDFVPLDDLDDARFALWGAWWDPTGDDPGNVVASSRQARRPVTVATRGVRAT